MRPILILLIAVLVASSAYADPIFRAERVVATSTVEGGASLTYGDNAQLDYIEAKLLFFPRDVSHQEVSSYSLGIGSEEGSYILYRVEGEEPEIPVFARNTVETQTFQPQIRQSRVFPLQEVPSELEEYLAPTSFIDSEDDLIVETASKIVEGETDLYKAVFKLGNWVNTEINYSLNTLTEKVSQPASWVLDNRFGVCDEITTLFVALNRAVGIPARFVSGMSYTNYQDRNDYGPHAWAEVWIGEWVPFDITYGEFGYVDAGHIVMSISNDSSTSSVEYVWLGENVEVSTHDLHIEVDPEDIIGEVSEGIELTSSFAKTRVGFGSHNLFEVTLKNTNDYYTGTTVQISRSNEMEALTPLRQSVLLAPFEETTLYWPLVVSEDLDPLYIYTLPVLASTVRNTTTQQEFQALRGAPIYSADDVDIIEASQEISRPPSVSLTCRTLKPTYEEGEPILADCELHNKGNTFVSDLNVCGDEECRTVDLGINQKKTVDFALTVEEPGDQEFLFSARGDGIATFSSAAFLVKDTPLISFDEITNPATVRYDDTFTLSFVIVKESLTAPTNLSVTLLIGKREQVFDIGTLTVNRKLEIDVPANQLNAGENTITIIAMHDEEPIEDTATIELVDTTAWQRFVLFFKHLF